MAVLKAAKFRDPKIHNLRKEWVCRGRCDEDVLRLDIAVDDVRPVGRAERVCCLHANVEHLRKGQRPLPASGVEALPRQILHYDVAMPRRKMVEIEESDDVRVYHTRD